MMRIYHYDFLKNMKVSNQVFNLSLNVIKSQSIEENQKKNYPDVFTKLNRIAIIKSVKSSNNIEGIVTTDKRIKEMIEGNSIPFTHNEQEIIGYRDALEYIHIHYQDLEINERTICELHRIMYSHTDNPYAGIYKPYDNNVTEKRISGEEIIRWKAVSYQDTPLHMQKLIESYISARYDYEINSLLLIPCFILDFLCIHPFTDGNGRISRLLTILLLYKAGYDIGRYISFEEKIDDNKISYYEALKNSSTNWHEGKNNYEYFIYNFILTLSLCYKELDNRFKIISENKLSKKDRIVLSIKETIVPFTKSDVMDMVPDASITLIEKELKELLDNEVIIKIGNTRDTKYKLKL